MKTEGEVNAWLSKKLRIYAAKHPEVSYLKVSDRFHSGVSDFLIWQRCWVCRCASAAIEVKRANPKGGKLLSHGFTGPQIEFLRAQEAAGCRGFGLIYAPPGVLDVKIGQLILIAGQNVKENYSSTLWPEYLKTYPVTDFPIEQFLLDIT